MAADHAKGESVYRMLQRIYDPGLHQRYREKVDLIDAAMIEVRRKNAPPDLAAILGIKPDHLLSALRAAKVEPGSDRGYALIRRVAKRNLYNQMMCVPLEEVARVMCLSKDQIEEALVPLHYTSSERGVPGVYVTKQGVEYLVKKFLLNQAPQKTEVEIPSPIVIAENPEITPKEELLRMPEADTVGKTTPPAAAKSRAPRPEPKRPKVPVEEVISQKSTPEDTSEYDSPPGLMETARPQARETIKPLMSTERQESNPSPERIGRSDIPRQETKKASAREKTILKTVSSKPSPTIEPNRNALEDELELGEYDEKEDGPEAGAVADYRREVLQIPLLTQAEEHEYGLAAMRGDKYAIDKLVTHNVRLVFSIAKKYMKKGLPFEDLIAEGNVGLMKAAEKFVPEHRFTTYATGWIRSYIQKALSLNSNIRIPVHLGDRIRRILKAMGAKNQETSSKTLESILDGITDDEMGQIAEKASTPNDILDPQSVKDALSLRKKYWTASMSAPVTQGGSEYEDLIAAQTATPEEAVSESEMRETVLNVLGKLKDKEKEVLMRRFGLGGMRAESLDSIGKSKGVTRERIRQIESKALRRLRHPNWSKLLQ